MTDKVLLMTNEAEQSFLKKEKRKALKALYAKADAKSGLNEPWGWYCIICGSAAECKVALKVRKYAELIKLDHLLGEYMIPTWPEKVYRADGSVHWKQERLFAGYLMYRMNLTTDLKNLIQAIPGVVGMVTDRSGLTPLRVQAREVDRIVTMMYQSINGEVKKEQNRPDLSAGMRVVIKAGPFENFTGVIKRLADGRVWVTTQIFGRESVVSFVQGIVAPESQH